MLMISIGWKAIKNTGTSRYEILICGSGRENTTVQCCVSEEALSKIKLMEEEKGMKLMEKEANQYPSEFLLAA